VNEIVLLGGDWLVEKETGLDDEYEKEVVRRE
jgi:hypothetical protein